MAVANLDRHGQRFIRRLATAPVDSIDLKLLDQQILRLANDNAIARRIDINHVAGSRRSAGQSFALPDGEHFDAFMLGKKVSGEIVDAAAMELRRVEMRT